MAARSRITVLLLLFLLSTEHSFAVNQNNLSSMVNDVLRAYRVKNMFSLAMTIPQKQNQNQNKNQNQNQDADHVIQEVLNSDPADNVKNKINNGEVYVGRRVVAATNLTRRNGAGASHAESHVVDKLSTLFNSPQFDEQDLLLFYVFASPCVEKCTKDDHRDNILSKINNIRRWKSYAVVFSKIFKPRNGQESIEAPIEARRKALKQLANYEVEGGQIGLENIYRCDRKDPKQKIQCVRCSSNDQVVDECVSGDLPSANMNSGTGSGNSKRRVRRDISSNTGDSSFHDISEHNKGAEDAPSHDGNGNDVATGEAASSTTGESVSDVGNGSDLGTVEDVSSPQIGFDSGDGNGKMSRGKGKVSKGKGGKGRRGKKGKGKGSRGKKGKGKGRRGKGGKGGKGRSGKGGKGKGSRGKGGKGKGSKRGGRSRRRGLDQEWIFATDF